MPTQVSDLRICPAVPEDAEALTAYMHRLTGEPHNNIVLDPGQWSRTLEEERAYIARNNANPDNGIFVVATIGNTIAGVAGWDRGSKPTKRHAASLWLSVDAAWRRQGIATALMHYMMAWARQHALVRLELKVFVRNIAAIHLYQKFGFREEGRHPYAFRKQGIWVDELTMALVFPPPSSLDAKGG
ncbi:MAG: GNAT family N-acetyltransferase [Phycisphaerales bacterium]|nr:GNAT family N-acetyltransferase [Phycisphaerales bacterium]